MSSHVHCSFRRLPRNGKSFFNMVVTQQQPVCHEALAQGKKLLPTVRNVMLEEHVDFVAGDFNGGRLAPPMRQRSKTHQYY